jgi:hypothetical protein
MNGAAYIFWIIFVIPLIAFLIWLMRQDKRKGKIGIAVVVGLVIMVVVYMYFKHMFAPYVNVPD